MQRQDEAREPDRCPTAGQQVLARQLRHGRTTGKVGHLHVEETTTMRHRTWVSAIPTVQTAQSGRSSTGPPTRPQVGGRVVA